MPIIEYQLASPDMLNRYFTCKRDGHDILHVIEGYPNYEQPYVYLASKPVEPLVTACARPYTALDPVYDFIGSSSGMSFGSIRRPDDDDRIHRPRLPAYYEVTDASDGTRYCWKEVQLFNRAYRSTSELRLVVTVVDGPCMGLAKCRLSFRKLLVHRVGGLWLGYDESPLNLNTLLHLAAFAYILTNSLPCWPGVLPPASPQLIWGPDYLHDPQPD